MDRRTLASLREAAETGVTALPRTGLLILEIMVHGSKVHDPSVAFLHINRPK